MSAARKLLCVLLILAIFPITGVISVVPAERSEAGAEYDKAAKLTATLGFFTDGSIFREDLP